MGGAFLGGGVWDWGRGGVKLEVEVDGEVVRDNGREGVGEGIT